MKIRIIAIMLAAASLLVFPGCGGDKSEIPDHMTETFYNAGVKFVDVIDQAIDMEIDAKEAAEKASVYVDILSEELESDEMEEAMENADVSLETEKLLMEQTVINAKTICSNLEFYDWDGELDLTELLDDRNIFADDFGIEDRSL